MIKMIPVENSSTTIEYGYDKENKALIVNYRKTGLYSYDNISEEEFGSISKAESIGKGIRAIAANKIYQRIPEDKNFIRKHE